MRPKHRCCPPAAAAGAILLALAACAASAAPEEQVHDRLLIGEIEQAYLTLQAAVAANPGDAELQRRLAELRVVYHLRQGQEKVFADEDWAAVEEFERVLLADPENIAARQWKEKALQKLAQRAADAGDEARARGKLEAALEHYQQAETYVPGFPPAVRGAQVVRDVFTSRRAKGHDNYVKGVRAQAGGQYDMTEYHMQIAVDSDPSLSAAKERSDIARRRIAERRLQHAEVAQERGWYQTALREYKGIAAEFPDLVPDLFERVAMMQREADALDKLNEGTILLQRGEFARARPLLEDAYEISAAQRGTIAAQLMALREADLDERYTIALDMELDYHYEAALRAYKAIDESWPAQLDVRTRIQNLESSLDLARGAQEKGERAEAAGDLEGAIAAYREALTYVPKFGDLAARLGKLREKVRLKAEATSNGTATPVPDKR